MLYALLTLCLFGSTTALFPACITIEAQQNFDIRKFTGTWFTWGAYLTDCIPLEASCDKMNFNQEYDGQLRQIRTMAITGANRKMESITETGYVSHLDERNRFRMTDDVYRVEHDEVVYSTDYESYSIVYKCPDEKDSYERMVMIYTRERNPSDDTIAKIKPIIDDSQFSQWNFVRMNQTDCDELHWGYLGWTYGRKP